MFFRLIVIVFCCIFLPNSYASKTEFLQLPEKCQPITEIHLGNKALNRYTYIYISPSCLHCARFISDTLEEFIEKNQEKTHIIIKLMPVSAKDIFIMKLINGEAKDEERYFLIFKNYIKRMLATINGISPTEEQIDTFKGSKEDAEMIKFQVGAYDFGFSENKIKNAYPNMKEGFEKMLTKDYAENVSELSHILGSKSIDLPLIVMDNNVYKKLEDTLLD